MADGPKTRLDRIGRDLSRTLLHGSRVEDNQARIRPLTMATGQQIRVDLPSSDLTFQFTAPTQDGHVRSLDVPVSRDQASRSQDEMNNVFANSATYLALKAAQSIPTWIFSQRSYSMPKSPLPKEDTIDVTAPRNLTLIKAPTSALSEVADKDDCYVSLNQFNDAIKGMQAIARSDWQPAIMIRFRLQRAENVADLPTGVQVFEIKGTSQADRYFLDKLGLLKGLLPGGPADKSILPDIESVSLALQQTSTGTPELLADWTITRTNLTREARSGQQSLRFAGPPQPLDLPYVAAVAHDKPDIQQSKDSVALLQMGSITNSGGYFLRAATTGDADTLILAVVLKTKADPDPDHADLQSAWLPPAANALALKQGTFPDSIRFNGLDHVTVSPATPPGHVSFGWTRTEPQTKKPEDKFGYGTISLVEYSAQDGTHTAIGLPADQGVAISPSKAPHGDSFQRARPFVLDKSFDSYSLHTGSTAAMRLLAPHHPRAKSLMRDVDQAGSVTFYYHSTLKCYDGEKQNRYDRIGDAGRDQVTIKPGFRDIFGNRFEISNPPEILRRLFYTDTLTSPGEWPGIRFAIYPGAQDGKHCLFLESAYRFVKGPPIDPETGKPAEEDLANYQDRKQSRLDALDEIRIQLRGVDGDVAITLSAAPLVDGDVSLSVQSFQTFLKDSIAAEKLATGSPQDPDPLPGPKIAILCEGKVSDLFKFEVKLTVRRTKESYGPSDTDLPDPVKGVLATKIKGQIMSASSLVALQRKASRAATFTELRNWTDSLTDVTANDTESEFRLVAEAFDTEFAAPFATRFGFLRNRLNQHELWLIPNAMFPTVRDRDWSFATARPLRNTLGTEQFQVPTFERCTSNNQGDCWGNYALTPKTVVDQDFDELGRIAFRLLEESSSNLTLVTDAGNVAPARQLLRAREKLGLALSVFGTDAPAYLVPLHDSGDELDGEAVTRAATDAFLSDLNGFYAIDTILQLPLAKAGDVGILTFEGKVKALDTDGHELPSVSANFSDVLLGGGKEQVTILYDLPPNVANASSAPQAARLRVEFSHIQRKLKSTTASETNPFSQGPWIEVINAPTLDWNAPDTIPVATRSFPSKPVMNSTEVLMPWLNLNTGEITVPQPITASTAELLVHWGWKFSFDLIDLRDTDKVHVTTSYNEPPSKVNQTARLDFVDEWKPTSLLNSLFAIKMLQDSAFLQRKTVSGSDRLQAAADLADFLYDQLIASESARLLTRELPSDKFLIETPQKVPSGPLAPAEDGGRAIMAGNLLGGDPDKMAIRVDWKGSKESPTATVIARAEIPGNNARVAGANAVQNYKATLNLRRNETFGPGPDRRANSLLIYNCAPVSSPRECWAKNIWSMPLIFDPKAPSLEKALSDFFDGILKGADPASVLLEVGASLVWKSGKLDIVTPFSIVPNDIPKGNAATIAGFILGKYQDLVRTSKPDPKVKAALRLWIKISSNSVSNETNGRVLMEVKSIDFAL